jgi:hypothetical protein
MAFSRFITIVRVNSVYQTATRKCRTWRTDSPAIK